MYRKVWSSISNNCASKDYVVLYHYLFFKEGKIWYAASKEYFQDKVPSGTIVKSYNCIPEELIMVRFKYLDFIWELYLKHLGSVVLIHDDTLFVSNQMDL